MSKLSDFEDDQNGININEFKINEEYAKRFEYNKKRQELAKLEEQYQDDSYESDSESDVIEDESGDLITQELESKFLKTLEMLRKKDPQVYDPNQKFFTEKEIEKAEKQRKEIVQLKKSEPKIVTLKDYRREQLLLGSESENKDDSVPVFKTYDEEQADILESFKQAVQDVDSDDDIIHLRKHESANDSMNSKAKVILPEIAVDQDEDKFLLDFVSNKGWVDEAEKVPTYDEIVAAENLDEDEAEDYQTEMFEHAYNFRFEDPASSQIMTYGRNVPGSIRRVENKRKEKRNAAKIQRDEEKEIKAEKKRLAELRKEQNSQRISKIAKVCGLENEIVEDIDLDGDFDPEKFDQMMNEKFGDDYYNREDVEINDDLEFMDDFEISNLVGYNLQPKSTEDKILEPIKKFDRMAELEKIEKEKRAADYIDQDESEPEEEEEDFVMDADYLPGGEKYSEDVNKKSKKERKKEKAARKKQKVDPKSKIDEYLAMNYEDLIGDLATKFRYRQVEAEDYGLPPEEIFEADDQLLNELLPLKKLAPFRSEEKLIRDKEIWKKTKRRKLKQFRASLEGLEATKLDEKKKGQAAKKAAKRLKKAGLSQERLASYSKPTKK